MQVTIINEIARNSNSSNTKKHHFTGKKMEPQKTAKGRGAALLERLRKQQQADSEATPGPPTLAEIPPKSRGRAALLQKIAARKAGGGGDAPPIPTPPQPSTSREVEKTVEKMTKLEVSQPSEPCQFRGTAGTPLAATANYIRLSIEEDRGVFEYEVRFRPDIDAKSNRIRLLNNILGDMALTKVYDGAAVLYLPSKFIEGTVEYDGVIPNTDDKCTMIVTYKTKKRLSECLHLYNVLFKRIMHVLLYTRMGRNYFSPDHRHIIPQHRLEVFPGYAVAVDEMEGGLMVCLDTQHRVVRSQVVYEVLHELQSSNPQNFRDAARQNLIGACVMTKYNNKTYIVDDIAWHLTPKDTFPLKSGETISFLEYYKKQYNITINDPDQPLLINRKKRNAPNGEADAMVCLLPELSFMTGLTDAMRADFKVCFLNVLLYFVDVLFYQKFV